MRKGPHLLSWLRSIFLLSFSVFLLFGCAPQKAKKFSIGILAVNAFAAAIDGFKSGLADRGYIEGNNVAYDTLVLISTAQDKEMSAIRTTIEKFIRARVSLIFVMGTPHTIVAKEMTKDTGIPVVFANALVELENVIRSVRDPGGNMTGVRYPGTDLMVKRFELLLQVVPKAKRVFVTFDPKNPSAAAAITVLRPAALSKNVTLVEVPIKGVDDIKADLAARDRAKDPGFDAILIMPEGFSQSPQGWGAIAAYAEAHRIPVIGSAAYEADSGAILTYIPSDKEVGELAATLAVKILNGTPAGSIPIISPESRLRLNLARALKLGIQIDEGLIKLADELIH